jgi:hypothetical protein
MGQAVVSELWCQDHGRRDRPGRQEVLPDAQAVEMGRGERRWSFRAGRLTEIVVIMTCRFDDIIWGLEVLGMGPG